MNRFKSKIEGNFTALKDLLNILSPDISKTYTTNCELCDPYHILILEFELNYAGVCHLVNFTRCSEQAQYLHTPIIERELK